MSTETGTSSGLLSRRVFTDISPASWEHPADRAALQTLRALPGFDLLIKRTAGAIGERGIRLMFQANAVRVQVDQFASLHRAMNEVKVTLDFRDDVPIFVSQAPWFNAGAYGVEKPFIVVNSATLDLLDERELRVLLAHELGHVMSGHALYHTMLVLILAFGLRRLPLLAGIGLVPIRLGLQEWSRKSELSADRAGLLGSQDPEAALSMFLKASGGSITTKHELNVAAYARQVEEYEENEGVDTVFKFLNLLDRSHPFHTLRAAELKRWGSSPEYAKILAGDYRRRSDEQPGSYGSDLNEAASYYAGEALERAREMKDMAKNIAQETTSYAKRAASEASEAARQAVDRLGEVLGRRREPSDPGNGPAGGGS